MKNRLYMNTYNYIHGVYVLMNDFDTESKKEGDKETVKRDGETEQSKIWVAFSFLSAFKEQSVFCSFLQKQSGFFDLLYNQNLAFCKTKLPFNGLI